MAGDKVATLSLDSLLGYTDEDIARQRAAAAKLREEEVARAYAQRQQDALEKEQRQRAAAAQKEAETAAREVAPPVDRDPNTGARMGLPKAEPKALPQATAAAPNFEMMDVSQATVPQRVLPQSGAAQARMPPLNPGGPQPTTQTTTPRMTTSGAIPSPDAQLAHGDDYNSQLGNIRKQRELLSAQLGDVGKPADYTQMQQQMRDRSERALPQSMAAVLMGMGPSAAKPLVEGITARANEYRQPMKIEGGMITPEGEVMLDPAFQKQKKMELLSKRLDALDKLEASVVDKRTQREIAQERNQITLMMGAMMADSRAMIAAMRADKGGGGKLHASTMVDARYGNPLFHDDMGNFVGTDPKTGQKYYAHPDNVRPPRTPTAGQEDRMAQAVENANLVNSAVNTFKAAVGRGESYGGITAGLVQNLPGGSQAVKKFRPDEYNRATENLENAIIGFRQGRTGVAVNAKEHTESDSYMPSPKDETEELLKKAQNFLAFQQRVIRRHEQEQRAQPGSGGAYSPGRVLPGEADPNTPEGRAAARLQAVQRQ